MARFFESIIQQNVMMQRNNIIESEVTMPAFVGVGGSAFRAVAVCLLNDLDKLIFDKNKVLKERLDPYFDDAMADADKWSLMSARQKIEVIDVLAIALSKIAFNEIGANPLLYSTLFLDMHSQNWVDWMTLLLAKPDVNCIAALARVLDLQIDVYYVKSFDDVYVVYNYGNMNDPILGFPLIISLELRDNDCFKPLVTNYSWYNTLKLHIWRALPFDPDLKVTPRNLAELKRRVFQSLESLKERFLHASTGINAMMLAGDLTLKDLEAIYCKGLDELSNGYASEDRERGTQQYFDSIFHAIGYDAGAMVSRRSYEEQVSDKLRDGIVRLICSTNPDLVDNYLDDRSIKMAKSHTRSSKI